MLKRILDRFSRRHLHAVDLPFDQVFLGTEYGGWPLLRDTRQGSLVYSFGLGHDISFDLGAIATFGCTVHGFDPTPRSLAWLASQNLPGLMKVHPVGLSDEDGSTIFFAPQNQNHVSFSSAPSHVAAVNEVVVAQVRRLGTLVGEIGTGIPDIVKMDIEGFEYRAIEDMIGSGIFPEQLLVEFHHGLYGIEHAATVQAVRLLKANRYRIFYISRSGREYGLVRRP